VIKKAKYHEDVKSRGKQNVEDARQKSIDFLSKWPQFQVDRDRVIKEYYSIHKLIYYRRRFYGLVLLHQILNILSIGVRRGKSKRAFAWGFHLFIARRKRKFGVQTIDDLFTRRLR
jgi:hypothetical protein